MATLYYPVVTSVTMWEWLLTYVSLPAHHLFSLSVLRLQKALSAGRGSRSPSREERDSGRGTGLKTSERQRGTLPPASSKFGVGPRAKIPCSGLLRKWRILKKTKLIKKRQKLHFLFMSE